MYFSNVGIKLVKLIRKEMRYYSNRLILLDFYYDKLSDNGRLDIWYDSMYDIDESICFNALKNLFESYLNLLPQL